MYSTLDLVEAVGLHVISSTELWGNDSLTTKLNLETDYRLQIRIHQFNSGEIISIIDRPLNYIWKRFKVS